MRRSFVLLASIAAFSRSIADDTVFRMYPALISVRRVWWSEQALAVGLVLSSIGICTSVPLVYVGYMVAGFGALAVPQRLAGFLVGWPWAVALSLWMALSGWLSPFSNAVVPPSWSFCWPALSIWALALSRPRGLFRAWIGVAVAGILAGGLALLQFTIGYRQDLPPFRLGSSGESGTQASGFYSHWIRYGDALAFVTVWLLAWLYMQPQAPWLRWVSLVTTGLLGVCFVFISGARGAVIALFSGVWILAIGTLRWKQAAVVSVGLLILLGIAGFLAWPAHGPRLTEAFAGHDGRTFIWRTAWETFLTRPWSGIGGYAYDEATLDTVARGLSEAGPEGSNMGNAHNSFLSLLVLYGIPGLTLWLGWLSSVVLHVWRLRHRHPAAWPLVLATLGVFVFGSLTEDLAAYAASRFQLFFGLALAMGCVALQKSESNEPDSGLRPLRASSSTNLPLPLSSHVA